VSSVEPRQSQTLILLGAGHANVAVIRHYAMHPDPHVRLIVVNPSGRAPYSGMLPGFLSGQYSEDDLFIDVGRLVHQAGGCLIRGRLSAIDATHQQVFIKPAAGGAVLPPIQYDVAVINTGAAPAAAFESSHEALFYVKPLSQLLDALPAIDQLMATRHSLAIVGGGAAGIELSFAMRARYGPTKQIRLITKHPFEADPAIAPASRQIRDSLQTAMIELHPCNPAVAATRGHVGLQDGTQLEADVVLVSTPVVSPQWLDASDLPRAHSGFLAVDARLAVRGCEGLYACGDVAELEADRPRCGVMAVRAGQYVARAVPQVLAGRSVAAFRPQKRWLTLLNRGNGSAIGIKGSWVSTGHWVWRLKDRIDRAFMARYQLPPMESSHPMRCEGCAAKLPGQALESVFGNQFEDAVSSRGKKSTRYRSLDALTYVIEDPYLMGRLAMRHAIADLWAMGAHPKRALGLIGVSRAANPRLEADEFRLVHAGLKAAAKQYGATLDGGHSLALSQAVVAVSVEGKTSQPVHKQGAQPGDVWVMSGPLGSGILMAGMNAQKASSVWIDTWLEQALMALGEAAQVAVSLNVSAMTDVTGFGLAGHIKEMLEGASSDFVWEQTIPVFDGVEPLLSEGVESTAAPGNRAYAGDLVRGAPHPVVFDPQTAGPLLVAIRPAEVSSLIDQWRQLGLDPHPVGHLTTETS
jgi:selenide,water dikinase